MGPEIGDDDDDDLPTEDEGNETGKGCGNSEADSAENDPLRTADPYKLCGRLNDKLRELRDRREAQDLIAEGEALLADLKRDPAERRAEMEQAQRARAEKRAARETPHGTKSATRAMGRFLTRCENAFEELIEDDNHRLDPTTRVQLASAAARLANAASALGNSISSNARTRAQLMRTRDARKHRKTEPEEGAS